MPHVHEKIDFTVEVFIVNKSRVLLRKHDKYDKWLGAGGHIELDEDPMQTAVREAKEEVGLDVTIIPKPESYQGITDTVLTPPQFMVRHHITEMHEHVAMIYFAISESDQVVEPETHEKSKGYHWFSAQDLDDPEWGVMQNVTHYAKCALQAAEKFAAQK